MPRNWLAILFMLGVILGGSDVTAAEFTDMVRDLNTMQNRMVMGDERARTNVARQFDLIEQLIETLEPDTWKEERNVRAAAIYLLCGGAPTRLREIFDADFVPDELGPLLEASLRYAEGQDQAATKLMDFDARRFPPMLGGHLALVQGGSVVGADNARAVTLLDLARLLMPASLVEEAALRREIRAVDPSRESDKLSALANRYVAKYAASPYAENFWAEIRAIVLDPSANANPARLSKFENTIDRASAAERLDIYLTLSRRALLEGRMNEANARLDRAERAAETPAARARVAAYRSAMKALSADDAASSSILRTVDAGALTGDDLEMLKIARAVLSRLEMAATAVSTTAEAAPEKGAPSAASDPAILVSARAALERSDELLQRRTRR